MDVAIRGGHSELAKTFLDASASDLAKHVTMIRQGAGEKNLAGAKAVFEAKESFVSRIPSPKGGSCTREGTFRVTDSVPGAGATSGGAR